MALLIWTLVSAVVSYLFLLCNVVYALLVLIVIWISGVVVFYKVFTVDKDTTVNNELRLFTSSDNTLPQGISFDDVYGEGTENRLLDLWKEKGYGLVIMSRNNNGEMEIELVDDE